MNIFGLDEDPKKAPLQMVDKHIVKMPTETCQMLHTNVLHSLFVSAHRREPSLRELKVFHQESHYSYLMKPAMLNHPSTIWARENKNNAKWLYLHGIALCDEYTHRYGKVHGTLSRIKDVAEFHESGDWSKATPIRIAMADEYRLCEKEFSQKNPNWVGWDFVIASYRKYYQEAKYKFANWKGRETPSWFDEKYGDKLAEHLTQKLIKIALKYREQLG